MGGNMSNAWVELKNPLIDLSSTDFQSNYFIDSNKELEQKRITFRLRKAIKSFDGFEKTECTMTIKGKANGISKHAIQDGISRVEELEHSISNTDFESMLNEPKRIPEFKYELVPVILSELLTRDFQISGQFENKRSHFKYNGLNLELDETTYPFGMAYELECEHSEPQKVKSELEQLFQENGIEYSYSKRSKFGNMKAGVVI
jgi:uncharacterized protein YjbK